MTPLPIDAIIPELLTTLERSSSVVLSAEPGAGKTTRVPLALLQSPLLERKTIIMLEPRRIAAIRAAEYIASLLNEEAGETVGYQIRGEKKAGSSTRLLIVTEGLLTRMLQDDASLPNTGVIIFDEFHERSIHADLGLALSLDVQKHLRNDLKLLVMSATIDGTAVSALLGGAPVLHCKGRVYPVDVRYLPQTETGFIEPLVVSAVKKGLRDNEGDVLVFLPGQGEIQKTESLLTPQIDTGQVSVHLLYGDAPAEQQRAALRPVKNGKRKVILSTNIAETSLTIDGVRIVVDSGKMRKGIFDPRRGMTGLMTVPISKASADQRKGRAGRQAPGICYRLWSAAQHDLLAPFSTPEIAEADLARFALELAQWGDPDGTTLKLPDLPPKAHFSQAKQLLRLLGAIDDSGMLTTHGKEMASLPVHPRLAHMMIKGETGGLGTLACDIAALLDDRNSFRGSSGDDVDLYSRYNSVIRNNSSNRFAVSTVKAESQRLDRLLHKHKNQKSHESFSGKENLDHLGMLLALAYPERIGKRKENGKYQLTGNSIAVLPKGSKLANEEYLAIGETDGAGSDVKIYLAEGVTEKEILTHFADQLVKSDETVWNRVDESVTARSLVMLGSMIIHEKKIQPDPERAKELLSAFITEQGLEILPWTKEASSLRERSEWIRLNKLNAEWIDLSDEHLRSTVDRWLAPFFEGMSRRAHLSKLNMTEILSANFSYQQRQMLDRLAPEHITVPTGSKIPIDYSVHPPVLAVRLQEMFGETETPTIGGGAVKVLLHLLSPSRRPLAVTQDLPSFWKNAYPGVRKDMRGEYPKHYWPEDPLQAEPTRKTKKGMEREKK